MFRALSTRRGQGYDRIVDESTASLLDAKLNRSKTTSSSPAGNLFNLPNHSPVLRPEFLGSSKFSRSKTTAIGGSPLPAHILDLTKNPIPESNAEAKAVAREVKAASRVHPLFSLFENKRRKKKATAKPEFSRYVQYLKEGGVWDLNSAKPVIY